MRRRALARTAFALACAASAQAEVVQTRRPPQDTWSLWSRVTLQTGLEVQGDSDKRQYDVPLVLEYNVSERLKLVVEPRLVHVQALSADAKTASGLGDLDTAIEYEFLRQRRYRPALTAVVETRWPTATSGELGNSGIDQSLGLIVSKDLVYVDLDLGAKYTFVGDRSEPDSLELSLTAEIPLTKRVALEAEIVQSVGSGRARGSGTPGGIASSSGGSAKTEGTLGLGWERNERSKYEIGVGYDSDSSWRAVVAVTFGL